VLNGELDEAGEPGVDDAFELESWLCVGDATQMKLDAGVTELVEVAGPRWHGGIQSSL
jgi:hypothetical protein